MVIDSLWHIEKITCVNPDGILRPSKTRAAAVNINEIMKGCIAVGMLLLVGKVKPLEAETVEKFRIKHGSHLVLIKRIIFGSLMSNLQMLEKLYFNVKLY